jgi:uncharacterized membrane protein
MSSKKIFWLFCFLTLGIALRLIGINKSLSGDEILTVRGASQNLAQMVPYLISSESHPPLYYLVLHYWLQISQSEFWLRFLSIIFGAGICIMGYLIGCKYYNEKIGLLALLFLIASSGLIWQAQYVRPYAFSTFFICLSIYFFLAILQGGFKWRRWFGYVLASLLSIYSFYFAGLVILGQNLFILFHWRKYRKLIKSWLLAQLSIAIIFYPWANLIIRQLSRLTNQQVVFAKKGFYFLNLHLGALMRNLAGCLGLDPLFLAQRPIYSQVSDYLLWLLVLLFGLGTIIFFYISIKVFKLFKENSKTNNLLFLILVIVCFIIGNFIHYAFNFGIVSYHFIPCFVFLVFVLISFILLIKIKWLRIASIVFLFTLSLIRTEQFYFLYPEPWKELVENIENESTNFKTIVCLLKGDLMSYNYYSHFEMPQIVLSGYFDRDPKNLDLVAINPQQSSKLQDLLSNYEQIWLIHFAHEVFGGEEIIKDWFRQQGYRQIKEGIFGQIIAVRYKRA